MDDDLLTDYDDGPPGEYLDASPARSAGGPGRGGKRHPRPSGGRVPPHNLDAEESLLGAMLLSRAAIDVASESVSPDDFYKPAHGHIYD
ncbi:MAG: replicative DNA helicase, partial [Acidimicrobiia bacterium]|nr:replicative DNA helicase [Acidimicrobiia bacterium]